MIKNNKQYLANIIRTVSRQTWLIFGVTALFFGGIFAIFTPPMLGVDEFHHFNRAYQVSQGGLRSYDDGVAVGGIVPADVYNYQRRIIEVRYEGNYKGKSWTTWTNEAFSISMQGPEKMASFPGAAAYSPLAYLPAATVLFIAKNIDVSFGFALIAMRLAMLIAFTVIICYLLYVIRDYKLKWAVVTLALWPNVIFQASMLTADTLAIALAFLIFGITFKAFNTKDLKRPEAVVLLVASIILPVIKFNYLLISLLALFIPALNFTTLKLKPLYVSVGSAFLMILLTFGWIYTVKDYADDNNKARAVLVQGVDSSTLGQVKYMLKNPIDTLLIMPKTMAENGKSESIDFVTRMAGSIGFNFTRLPTVVIVMSWILLILMLLYAKSEIQKNKKFITISSLMGLISCLGVFLVLYLTWSPIGSEVITGVQGRYFIPVLLYIMSGLVLLLPIRISFTQKRKIPFFVIGVSVIGLCASAVYYLGQTYAIL